MREVTFDDRIAVASHAEKLLDEGNTIEADALIDAVRCCDVFPECAHVSAWCEEQDDGV